MKRGLLYEDKFAFVQQPLDLRKFLLIISEDEFLIESVHALFIEEIHQFCVAVCLRLQRSLGDEVTGGN